MVTATFLEWLRHMQESCELAGFATLSHSAEAFPNYYTVQRPPFSRPKGFARPELTTGHHYVNLLGHWLRACPSLSKHW